MLFALLGRLVVADLASAQPAPPAPAGAREIGRPLAVPRGVPIQVREAVATPAGVQATLVNVAPHPITMYEVALQRADGEGLSMTSASGMNWQPGVEVVVLLTSRPVPDDVQVVVRAAMGSGGEEYGEEVLLRRHRDQARARTSALGAVIAVLDEAGVPSSEDALQGLVDRLALTMARAPRAAANETGLSSFVAPMAALKRLQGRDLAGTERLANELRGLRERLAKEAAEDR